LRASGAGSKFAGELRALKRGAARGFAPRSLKHRGRLRKIDFLQRGGIQAEIALRRMHRPGGRGSLRRIAGGLWGRFSIGEAIRRRRELHGDFAYFGKRFGLEPSRLSGIAGYSMI
jgi:hypothetical protein